MKDPLREYFRKHNPTVRPASSGEFARICQRIQEQKTSRQHRAWYYVSAATLAAAGLMGFLNFSPVTERDSGLEPDDVFYQVEAPERGAYQDWLLIAEQIADEADEGQGPTW